MENLNELAKTIHDGNVARGFYDGEPKQIGTQLMLVVSELAEALEADRKGRFADKDKIGMADCVIDSEYQEWFKANIKDTFEDEIADTFIRMFDLVGWLKIDIVSHIKAKLKYNATRPYKHGKKY